LTALELAPNKIIAILVGLTNAMRFLEPPKEKMRYKNLSYVMIDSQLPDVTELICK